MLGFVFDPVGCLDAVEQAIVTLDYCEAHEHLLDFRLWLVKQGLLDGHNLKLANKAVELTRDLRAVSEVPVPDVPMRVRETVVGVG